MIEIRFHGRGGQGGVIASKILANAAFLRGMAVQSFPQFGVERRGAPIQAYTRIDDTPILLRTNIYEPDHIVVLDPTLLETQSVATGLKPGGTILINTSAAPEAFDKWSEYQIATVDASAIAARHGLGSTGSPVVNTAILGAFAATIGIVDLDAVTDAIAEEVPVKPDENKQAAVEAFGAVRVANATRSKS